MIIVQVLVSVVLLGQLVKSQSDIRVQQTGIKLIQYWYMQDWHNFCSKELEMNTALQLATVVCRQLGYSDEGAILSEVTIHADESLQPGITFTSGMCRGTESTLDDCGLVLSLISCTRVLGVTCQPADCTSSNIRLVDGCTRNEGRVEVCVDGRWGTVCNNSQKGIAQAVCSQLGFITAAVRVSPISTGSHPIHSCTTENNHTLNCNVITDGLCDHSIEVECRNTTDQNPFAPCSPTTKGEDTTTVTKALTSNDQDSETTNAISSDQSQIATNESDTVTANSLQKNKTCTTITLSPSESVTSLENMDTTTQTNVCDTTIITVLGAVIGIMVVLQAVTVTGWIVSCCVTKRQQSARLKPSSSNIAADMSGTHSLNDQVYYSEATPTQHNYSYNVVTMETEGLNTYESVGQTQQRINTQDTQANSSPLREEASKATDFYDAEEHTYAVVNKKKKVSEDGEGEGTEVKGEEPQSES